MGKELRAKHLAGAALGLWLASLPLLAFKAYGAEGSFSGLQVLLAGWLGPLELRFGWYANPLFLVAVFRLLRSAAIPLTACLLALVLSLDTFLLDRVIRDENGGSTPLYGYGFGAIVWLLAICVLLAAVGLRLRENRSVDSHELAGRIMVGGAAGLALMLVTVSVAVGGYQRSAGNEAERHRLANVVFKRGAICKASDPVSKRVAGDRGILELVGPGRAPLPFNGPQRLLEWGVPIVRMNGVDYSVVDAGMAPVIQGQASSTEADMRLEIGEKRAADGAASGGFIHLKLKAGGEVAFEQTWIQEHAGIYCPDYRSHPRADENPRKPIAAAMDMGSKDLAEDMAEGRRRLQLGYPTRELIKVGAMRDVPDRIPGLESRNMGCAPDVGYRQDFLRSHPEAASLGTPLQAGSRFYFTALGGNQAHAVCVGDVAYLFGLVSRSSPMLSLIAQKWNLKGAKMEWVARVVIKDDAGVMPAGPLTVWSVGEEDGMLRLRLTSAKTGQGIRVAAPLSAAK